MKNLINKLKYWLKPKNELFEDFQSFMLDRTKNPQHRIFIDRDSDVLFVSHIDTVKKPKFIRKTKRRIYASGLDNRLGCLIAYELSKELKADLLICDHEEMARSSGQFHELKEYNWIVEFDRAGDDVVTYDLDCKDFRRALSDYWKIGFGCFSDVCQLNTNVCCMNVGIGYEFAHSVDSYVCKKTMNRQIEKFKQFYQEHKDTQYKQDKQDDKFDVFDYWNVDHKQYAGECELCGIMANVDYIFGHIICKDCFDDMYNQYCFNVWRNEIASH